MTPEWIIALAAVVYTGGTFLLWHTTQKSLRVTQEWLRLTLLVEYFRAQEPAPNVGHPWETREVPEKINTLRARQTEIMRRAFPELEKMS